MKILQCHLNCVRCNYAQVSAILIYRYGALFNCFTFYYQKLILVSAQYLLIYLLIEVAHLRGAILFRLMERFNYIIAQLFD